MTIEYSKMIAALVKPGNVIQDSLTGQSIDLWHMATGISGEAGELLDAVKKHVIYTKPLDIDNIIEELGDLEFYMEGLRQNLRITREETIQKNIEKLSVRYHGLTYSDQKAQDRADKK